jgi:hypothetical protein
MPHPPGSGSRGQRRIEAVAPLTRGVTVMRSIVLLLAATSLLAAGCSIDTSRAARVDAFDAQGRTTASLDQEKVDRLKEDGMIIAFEPGDEITLRLGSIDSDLFEKVDDTTLKARRPFYVYIGPGGFLVSLDENDFSGSRVQGFLEWMFQMKDGSNTMLLGIREKRRAG